MAQRDGSIVNEAKRNIAGIAGVIIALSFIVTVLFTSSQSEKGIYQYFWIIPMLYGFFTMLFLKVYTDISLISGIILTFMFIRYCATPFLLVSEGFPRSIYTTYLNNESMRYAVFLMAYEMLMLYLGLNRVKGRRIEISENLFLEKFNSKENFSRLSIPIIGIIAITLLIYGIYPSLLSNYTFIVNADMDRLTHLMAESQASLPSGMRWIGYTFGEVTRYIILQWIIVRCFNKYKATNKIRYYWISLFLISINAVVATSRIMLGIIMSIALFYQIYTLYPQKRRLLFLFFLGVGSAGILIVTLTYWTRILSYQALSQVIQGYTNGYYNVYTSRQAYVNANLSFFDKIEMLLVGDGIANIDIVGRFFNGKNSSDIINFYLYGREFNGGAVLPLVSQTSYYLTPLFGPIISYFCVIWAKKYELRSKVCYGNVTLNMFASCMFSLLPFMYNWTLLLHIISICIVPLWICSKINKYIIIKNF